MNQLIENYYTLYSVYALEGLLVFFGYFLILYIKNIPLKKLINYFVCLFIGIFISGLIFHYGKVDFKILSDETNLLSVSRGMVESGKMFNTIDSVLDKGGVLPIVSEVPTRGALFPYSVAVIHRIRGVFTENVFILNFITLSLLISLIFYFTSILKLQNRILLILASVLSPPLFIFSTSGGFDLFSFLFAILNLVFLKKYFEKPNRNNLNLIIFSSICFSSVRYESIVGACLIWGLIIFIQKKNVLKDIKHNYFLLFVPLFLLPIIIQRYLTWGKFENPIGTDAFSLFNFNSHLAEFLKSWFIMINGPYPVMAHWIGIFGIYFLLRKKNSISTLLYKLSFIYIIFLMALLLSHHLGKALFPTQVRLFIPISLFFVFSAIYVINISSKLIACFFSCLLLIQVFFNAKYSYEDKLTEELTLTRETQTLRKLLAASDYKNVQFVYDRPGQFYAFGYAALGFSYLSEHQFYKIPNNVRLIAITRIGPDNPTPVISNKNWDRVKVLSFQLTDYTTVYFEELHAKSL